MLRLISDIKEDVPFITKQVCNKWACPGAWKCKKTNKCISLEKVCDSHAWNCGLYIPGSGYIEDTSDEDPSMCQHWACAEGYWKCDDGLQCIEETNVCKPDLSWWGSCSDGSHNTHCDEWECPDGWWKCHNNER